MTPLYYVSYGNEVRVDLRNRVPAKHLGTSLAVFHRSGLAWLYRGVLIGVRHDRGYWRHSRKHKSNIWYRPWAWCVWTPGSVVGCTSLDQLPARTLIKDLFGLAGITRSRVDSALAEFSVAGVALDGVPWAIHKIPDERAREAAIEAYQANRDGA